MLQLNVIYNHVADFSNLITNKYKNMNLNELAKEIHNNNVEKGFYDKHNETGTKLMLVVSELGEAMEALRNNKFANLNEFEQNVPEKSFVDNFKLTIKDTFEDEMADALIRILDICYFLKINIQKHTELKIKYNKTRPYRHGKKF